MALIRAAATTDLPAIATFLAKALSGGGPERYQRYFEYQWLPDKPNLGVLLEDNGHVRGFIGAIYADRRWQGRTLRCCNLTSIAVDEDYRRHTLKMFATLFAAKTTTFTCFSASPEVERILAFFKFVHRPSERVVVTPLTGLGDAWSSRRVRVIVKPSALEAQLDPDQRALARDHRLPRCSQLLVTDGNRRCFAVTTRRGRGAAVFADVIHASDPELLMAHLPAVHLALFRAHRTIVTAIDRSWVIRQPRVSLVYRRLRPVYLRSPDLALDQIDALYSELVLGAA